MDVFKPTAITKQRRALTDRSIRHKEKHGRIHVAHFVITSLGVKPLHTRQKILTHQTNKNARESFKKRKKRPNNHADKVPLVTVT
jgi:hypothetical protein